MRALFPPWSDTIFRICLVAAVAGVVWIPASMMLWVRTPYVTMSLFAVLVALILADVLTRPVAPLRNPPGTAERYRG